MKKNILHKNRSARFAYSYSYRKAALSIITGFVLISLLFVVSCTPLNTSSEVSNNNDNTESETVAGNTEEAGEDNNEKSGETDEDESNGKEESEETKSGDITINVYYADDMGEYLVGEARTVSSENKYVDALYELMKLPIDSSLYRLVSENTKVNSVTVENGLAKVDLSKEFVEERFQSDTTDILLIYSIVNTLTEFPEVNSVSFYIDGEKLDILGQLAIDEPIFRRSDLIKE